MMGEGIVFSTHGLGTTEQPICKRMKLDPFPPISHINSKWIIDINLGVTL